MSLKLFLQKIQNTNFLNILLPDNGIKPGKIDAVEMKLFPPHDFLLNDSIPNPARLFNCLIQN